MSDLASHLVLRRAQISALDEHSSPTPARGQFAVRIGADIGGTFTDLVVVWGDGRFSTKKVLSTPSNYAEGIVAGLTELFADLGERPAHVAEVAHGTTIATNAVLERQGALTGLITTKGFRDVLELRRMRFPDTYNVFWDKPVPLVERYLRLEVDERLDATGAVERPLDLDEARRVIRRLVDEGAVSIAVSLLHSYVNPEHERRLGDLIRAEFPGIAVTLSSDVLPEIKEYERTSTAVVNAYVMPVVSRYLGELQSRLASLTPDSHADAPLLVMQSNGGLVAATRAAAEPVHVLESGPAAGVVGAVELARALGWSNAVTFDMGGTTAKAALIEGGEPFRSSEYEVGAPISIASRVLKGGGYLLRVPAIGVAEVGAGGGSIVRAEAGVLQVGPRSAGADPGPVCYGRGGTSPTITDANVVLGYLNPEYLVGGALPIDRAAAAAALASVADELGLSLQDTAFGVYRIANATMMRAVRAVSIERGRDVREFALVVFGGNGPVHAVDLARSLGIRRVVVPVAPGLFSAIGLLFADVEHHYIRTLLRDAASVELESLWTAYRELEARGVADLRAAGWTGAVGFTREADLRYRGQHFELRIPVGDGADGIAEPRVLGERFAAEHERTYGHGDDVTRIELVNLRLIARGRPSRPDYAALGRQAVLADVPTAAPVSRSPSRRVYFGPEHGQLDTPVVRRADLRAGASGPLIVEEYDTTIVIPPGARASVDELANVVIEVTRTEG